MQLNRALNPPPSPNRHRSELPRDPSNHAGSGTPPPFDAAPSAPVSEESPFAALAMGPSSATTNSEFTTWRCGGSVMNAALYHSLTLSVENGICQNDTLATGAYMCEENVVAPKAYNALVTGKSFSLVNLLAM